MKDMSLYIRCIQTPVHGALAPLGGVAGDDALLARHPEVVENKREKRLHPPQFSSDRRPKSNSIKVVTKHK